MSLDSTSNGGDRAVLELYLEALPTSYLEAKHEEIIKKCQGQDGSLFQSPCALMATGNIRCMTYLEDMVKSCRHGGKWQNYIE